MKNQEIQNLIKELIEKTTVVLNDVTIDTSVFGDGSKITWFAVEVKEPHFFLSHDGEALYALNHLIKRITEPKGVEASHETEGEMGHSFLVDVNGFHKKRVEDIKAIVHMMAERARYFKSNVEVEPMSAFDRRIVHELLSQTPDLTTESQGFGPARRIVIKYNGTLSN